MNASCPRFIHRLLRIVGWAWLGIVLPSSLIWAEATGVEGQRVADQGDGNYLNPVLAGDHADPSVLKQGDDYYMVHSSFGFVPGLLIWHSRDLVNWQPIGAALRRHVGVVWAPDLSFHDGRYHIYFPVLTSKGFTNMVVTASTIRGPWSEPVDLQVGNFDPGHAVDDEGNRFLFFNGGNMAPLSADGLRISGPSRHVYDGWPIPEDWKIETFGQEGPKMLRHGDYHYMVLAEGGTAGPATSHMVLMARAKSLDGPWENSPYNPVLRTRSADEKWWSRGHATLIEGPDEKQWYLLYHAYENGYYNLGRQTLLEPVTWTEDGWVKAILPDADSPIRMPEGGTRLASGMALSDEFATDEVGRRWAFFMPKVPIEQLYRIADHTLTLKATGSTPGDTSPLTLTAGDHAYEIEVEIERDPGATGGLLLFYNERLFAGLGFSSSRMVEYWKGETSEFDKPAQIGDRYFLRIRNDHHHVTVWYSADGSQWTKHWMHFEVSGYHHNVGGGFLALRPALLATGEGDVRFRHFRYRALP